MAAHESLNNYLFGRHFKAQRGMSIEDALSGKIAEHNYEQMSPEAYDSMMKDAGKYGEGLRPFAELHADLTQPTDVGQTVTKLQGNFPGEHLVGNQYRVAASLRDLTHVVRTQGQTNTMPLYRGAPASPIEQIGETKDTSLPFTPHRAVAVNFARAKGGRVYEAEPGSVRGVILTEIGGRPRTTGKSSLLEQEWLIDPLSITSKMPSKSR